MTKIFLRKKITNRIAEGHPWIFANEIGDEAGKYTPGSIVSVFSYNGSFVGKGYINPASIIRIRLLSSDPEEEINDTFFYHRILNAWHFRKKTGHDKTCRVVFGEADDLPGLIIDKYNDIIVFQTLTLGMDIRKAAIIDGIQKIFNTKKIFEKNDSGVRKLEGLPLENKFSIEEFSSEILFGDEELQFKIDIKNSQKTGFFWEQTAIAKAIQPLANNATVLDVCCASGWCSINAIKSGALSSMGIDQDLIQVNLANENAQLNGLADSCTFIHGNAFDILRSEELKEKRFDLIILDPPSLAKSKSKINQALSGYKELNLRCMKLLKNDGILISTCSSFIITEAVMIDLLVNCAKDCGKKIRLIGKINQGSDHPIIWNLPSTNYFKGFIMEVRPAYAL